MTGTWELGEILLAATPAFHVVRLFVQSAGVKQAGGRRASLLGSRGGRVDPADQALQNNICVG